MDTIGATIKVGQKIPKEVLKQAKKQYREAGKAPKVYDPDCPPSTPEALAEFAAMAQELRKSRRNPSSVVAIRVKPDTLSKYKALGKGYTGIMADVLNYVADNPEILSQAAKL
ncbi:MAG: BrnA antitoxin family protein [Treponema sp.]|nr:BrnA antitoxin family protein [Treponema sp.]